MAGGLVGAVATAGRPMGAVLVVGLAVRAWDRRRDASPSEASADEASADEASADGAGADGAAATPTSAATDGHGAVPVTSTPAGPTPQPWWQGSGVLLSAAGLVAFCLYLWVRFGDPLAFLTGQEAWDQQAGLRTWLKVQFFEDVTDVSSPLSWLTFVAHPVLTVAGLALVPRIYRRFGRGYAVYVLLLIGLSALSTKNFFGMSRYLLAAFPCFAVAAELVADRPALRRAATAASGIGLVLLTAAFSRGYYLS